jgi:hypothetical protein
MAKIAESGSGSISQRHGSPDPDLEPLQNVMDLEHCFLGKNASIFMGKKLKMEFEDPAYHRHAENDDEGDGGEADNEDGDSPLGEGLSLVLQARGRLSVVLAHH